MGVVSLTPLQTYLVPSPEAGLYSYVPTEESQ